MSVIYIVLPLALVLALIALVAFIWSVRGGQFDDLSTPSLRMLHDDEQLRQTGDTDEVESEDD
ncbi:Cytochrome oxidase maturation protein cbb3-type [Poriferisphaera corsica]|uniref:Cytochrome oxidase maturation protein cbb3-type n=1 Tax=Poriferisphaera corsica TaxID=2528020 RepID=A0A517YPE8_9BACT|nr:cbb3-type cytochrome oxidase assembly protein CcoS [Poriferisphaera corsica]QDU32105.1 Cytochrome oxidase maturation protein cbb3-type [Poriferisphaera corsica]